ncbi:hypothetical protein R6Q59_014442 [Mikania micrantha]
MREGGRGRENDRGRENQTQWKSWRNKDGIQPEEHVDEESTKEGWQHVRRNNQGGNRLQRNYQLKEKATSFFLQNLPEELSEKELWRECINYGHVVDAYIVRKRDIAGRRFGFARSNTTRIALYGPYVLRVRPASAL